MFHSCLKLGHCLTGVSLQELKTQLHKQIKIMRGVSHMEAVIKHRLENEDLDDEEEYFTDEYGSNIEDECKGI